MQMAYDSALNFVFSVVSAGQSKRPPLRGDGELYAMLWWRQAKIECLSY
jgi:hypothetical protein